MTLRVGDLAVLYPDSCEVDLRQQGRMSGSRLRHGELLLVLRRWDRSLRISAYTAWIGDVEVLTPRGETGWVSVHRLEAVQLVAATRDARVGAR